MSGTTTPGTGTGTTTASGREALVTRLYDTLFNRAPDSEGLAFWTGALGRGITPDAVADQLVASPEFSRNAGLSNPEVVNLFYRNGLEREADTAGRDFYTGGLQRNATDRGGVALALAESPEGVASALPGAGPATPATGTGMDMAGTPGTGTPGTGTTGTGTTGTGTDMAGTPGTDTTGTSGTGTDTTGTSGTGTDMAGTSGTDTTGTPGTDTMGTSGTGTDMAGTPGTGTTDTSGTDTTGTSGTGTDTTGTSGTDVAGTPGTGTTSSTGASDADTFTFVEVFRTPEGDFRTVTVIGESIPVGSEIVDIRPATEGDMQSAVVFDGDAAAALAPSEWFIG